METFVNCAGCIMSLTHKGRGRLVCNHCGYVHELDNFIIESIGNMIWRERSEVVTAFFNSAYYLNHRRHNESVRVSTGVVFHPLDLISFDLMAIEQSESAEDEAAA